MTARTRRFQSVAELRAALGAIEAVPAWTADDARGFWRRTPL